jgi:sugar lactone lactonase YvrE
MGSDGMTLDKHGNLYLTGDGVHVFNRDGKKIYHISIPEKWTSNVTFGGKIMMFIHYRFKIGVYFSDKSKRK